MDNWTMEMAWKTLYNMNDPPQEGDREIGEGI